MKKVFFILIFSFFGNLYAQKWELPPIKLDKKVDSFILGINQALDIKDTNTLVVAVSIGNGYSGMHFTRYIIYHPNRKVTVYISSKPIFNIDISSIKKIKLNRKESKIFQSFLNSSYQLGTLNINKDSLNITTKPSNDGFSYSVTVSDASTYQFFIWKSDKFSAFGTYAPRTYINENYPGKTDRKKILTLINGYDVLIKKVNVKR